MPLIQIEAKGGQPLIINSDQILMAQVRNGKSEILLRDSQVVFTEHGSTDALLRDLNNAILFAGPHDQVPV